MGILLNHYVYQVIYYSYWSENVNFLILHLNCDNKRTLTNRCNYLVSQFDYTQQLDVQVKSHCLSSNFTTPGCHTADFTYILATNRSPVKLWLQIRISIIRRDALQSNAGAIINRNTRTKLIYQ